jgi:hypothetical protein
MKELVTDAALPGEGSPPTRLGLVRAALEELDGAVDPNDRIRLFMFGAEGEATVAALGQHPQVVAAEHLSAAQGKANLYGGLNEAIDAVLQEVDEDPMAAVNYAILLLTAGVPSQGPPNGREIAEGPAWLREKLQLIGEERRQFTISTFGFGNGTNSALLRQLAEIGDGVYSACPTGAAAVENMTNFVRQWQTCVLQRTLFPIHRAGEPIYSETVNLFADKPMDFVITTPVAPSEFHVQFYSFKLKGGLGVD